MVDTNNSTVILTPEQSANWLRCKKLIVTGPVGVGKSTVLTYLKTMLEAHHINYAMVPEYITGDPNGQNMFEQYITHRLTAYEFQTYILNYFDNYMASLDVSTQPLILYERLPDDVVTCFSNKMNKENLITDKELYTLFERAQKLNIKYGLASYFDNNNNNIFIHSLFNTDNTLNVANRIFTNISEFISDSLHNSFIIGFYNTVEECTRRIIQRNRDGENNYTNYDIKTFIKHYLNLYTLFITGKHLRYCEIGTLLT